MKIQHLLEELVRPQFDTKKYRGAFKHHRYSDDEENPKLGPKELGRGFFSSVKNDPTDPHMVKKHGIKPSAQDAYNTFIEYLITHDMMDNIHFPKVYNITQIRDRNGHIIHTFKIEKLIPYLEANDKEVEAFIHRSFDAQAIDIIKEKQYDMLMGAEWYIASCLDRRPELIDHIIDDSLKAAIHTIKDIEASDRHLFSDIKVDNIMWRRTPHGLVLVFIDPLG